MLIGLIGLVSNGNEVVAKLLDSVGSRTGLDALGVMCDEDSLGGLDDDDALFALFGRDQSWSYMIVAPPVWLEINPSQTARRMIWGTDVPSCRISCARRP